MDNAALNKVLADADHEHFWIVLWGDPEHSADEDVQGFNEDFYDQGLARRPEAMGVGDTILEANRFAARGN